jgi:tetratricopeptide (TPR) repeat protein
MPFLSTAFPVGCVLILISVLQAAGGQVRDSTNIRELLQAGNEALSENRLTDAARAFQRVVDLNPSSAKGHEGLGIALSRRIISGKVRPADDAETIDRAESHLKEASRLSPSSPVPLQRLADLEAELAKSTFDGNERAQRYAEARQALKQVISLDPSNRKAYLQLANMERDEFGPPIQQAQSRMGEKKGPLPNAQQRESLRRQYGALIDDAISNAQQATNMNGNDPRPLLLLSRIYRERAVLSDSPDQYSADMRKAQDWQQQFLAVGGHLGSGARR